MRPPVMKIHPRTGHVIDIANGWIYFKDTSKGLKPLAMSMCKDEYIRVATGGSKASPRYTSTVHRMVWEAATGRSAAGLDVHHKNGIKADNRIENLEAIPHAKNVALAHAAKKISKELAGLDEETRYAIVVSADVRGAVEWATELGVTPEAILELRGNWWAINLPVDVAEEIRRKWAKPAPPTVTLKLVGMTHH